MEKIRKRNLLFTFVAFMLAVLSAVLIFFAAPNRPVKADGGEVKESAPVKKTQRELNEYWLNYIGEKNIKSTAKNIPETVDYTEYSRISSGTITNLVDKIIVFKINFDPDSGSPLDLVIQSTGNLYLSFMPDMAFVYPAENNPPCVLNAESAQFADLDGEYSAIYISSTMTTVNSETINMEEVTFNINLNDYDNCFFYAIGGQETENETPTEQQTVVSNKTAVSSGNVTSSFFVKVVSVLGVIALGGVAVYVVNLFSKQKKKNKK